VKKYLVPVLILAAVAIASFGANPAEYFNAKAIFFTDPAGGVSPVTAANPLPTSSTASNDSDKIGQPIFYRSAILTASATLFTAVVGTVATDSEYVITFQHASYMGPASTTAAYVIASGTAMAAGTQLSFKPGTALDFGIVGNGAIASFSAIKFPLN
jgi:hypothetical protein